MRFDLSECGMWIVPKEGKKVLLQELERLGINSRVLFPELDGMFPNHPADPIQVENLKDLQRTVLDTGADIGLAFDGDADRVFLVDDLGAPVSGSTTTAIVANTARASRERVFQNTTVASPT